MKKHGHSTRLVVLSRISGNKNEEILDEYINNNHPHLICFTAVSSEYSFVASLARYVKKKYPHIYLLVGGAHVSLNPEGVLDDFDALCVGEGEYPVLELVSQLEKGRIPLSIPNLWIKHEDKIEKNKPRPFLQNLDELPFPDREMWQEWIEEEPNSVYAVLLGRGCPFNCTYCCNHALRKLASGTYTRYRSPDNILSEIEELTKKHVKKKSKREIYLEVETIGTNADWVIDLCSKLENFNKGLSCPWSFGTNLRVTPNLDVEPIFSAFKRANFRFVNIGLESGSERVRREILKRNYSNDDIIRTVKRARKYGLQVCFLNMMGLPGETINDFKETVRMNRLCQPDWTSVSIFYPYPGTDLFALCEKKGLIKGQIDTENEREKAILNLPGFSRRQIQRGCVWFEYNVYKRHRPRISLLRKSVGLIIRSNSYLFKLYKMVRRIPAPGFNKV
ncbi:hypothetical protein A2276_05920 [candidate division WOR-1 bacterium RIFOXYA12_FULL_43_27]|uniref:Uncharacterized protein n=1 Tax=candidate division WOR-1 bacterium RIFOXYC2_FULL_46_14 TaxID=1802587 RepID=A0A1F4U3A8_UNCSA|nr:MAG: hypothetical protein A2276_05920 [candidate division WOR-1 bacterium RIFOXYA12_FULL_43_27]OGC20199.1 MAG: hypothetical protein A2292_03920 [candidate division WOR-1 bacterium RIFOXYB2_FULL_46_45]OGC39465.1 MAG: hypothetical protein A2438_07890 [candidate division WOR-1 bacterium RIFOXYC2_FULL_46_14]